MRQLAISVEPLLRGRVSFRLEISSSISPDMTKKEIGQPNKSALLIDEYGELDVQRQVKHCLWMMQQGKVHTPPAWLTASLKDNWSAPHGIPSDWLPTVLRFLVDENTLAEFTRITREDKKAS